MNSPTMLYTTALDHHSARLYHDSISASHMCHSRTVSGVVSFDTGLLAGIICGRTCSIGT